MTVLDNPTLAADEVFAAWLDEFGAALELAEPARVADCVLENGYWRDMLALTWGFHTYAGRADITAALAALLPEALPKAVRAAKGRTAPRLLKRSGKPVVEAFFDFDTTAGRGTGFVRLLVDPERPHRSRAWLLLTSLQELHGFEEKIGDRRPTGVEYSENFAGDNWLDQRVKEQAYTDRDPEVLVVGGGQAGLILAARLRQFGVDALIVEKHGRVGDNWRTRYHSLTLHNEVWANSLPYVPFPPTWPTFVPKDKLAGFLEAYAEFMELNVWTGTEFAGADYDERAKLWTARVTRADGTPRVLRVPHLVLATGSVSGVPNRPALPGLDGFAGEVLHSSEFGSGVRYRGRRAIVVGTGNSGHDVAQDLCASGVDVTIVQRSPTYIVSIREAQKVYSVYTEGLPFEDCDLLATSMPYPVLRRAYQLSTAEMREADRALLKSLEERGFRLTYGEDDTGFQMMYLRRGGGYYFNVGCSDMIVDGRIALQQYDAIDRFVPEGVALREGTTKPLDLVVVATGYESQQEFVRATLGEEVAERIGPVWGFDEAGELRNMWTPTRQDGLWFTAGSLAQCRIYSRYLALQIKAREDGLV